MDLDKTMDLFKGAKFGDKFLTRDGRIAILIISKNYQVMLEDTTEYSVMSDGLAYDDMATNYDIVSRYKEPIDEDKLEELAINECFEILKGETFWYEDVECVVVSAAEECYKAGYRKARED